MKIKRFLGIIFVIILYITFFTNVKFISENIYKSLIFCSKTIIPSVFPFMFLSLYIEKSNLISSVINDLKIKKNIFGICKIYLSSVILGSLSGFLIGAKCICNKYKSNHTDDKSFNHAIAVSSNAGMGFVVSCVGIIIWGSPILGILVYLFQIMISLLLGILIYGKGGGVNYESDNKNFNKVSGLKIFTSSISDSLSAILNMCAFIVSFNIIISLLCIILPDSTHDIIKIVMEFSSGSFRCINSKNNFINGFFSGFCIGFGGFCAVFQIISECSDLPLYKLKFIFFKILHGFCLGIITGYLVLILKVEGTKSSFLPSSYDLCNFIPLAFLYIIKIFFILRKKEKISIEKNK